MVGINPKIKKQSNKQLLIYGFDYYTRSVLTFLANSGYYIDGFVIDCDDNNIITSYLNKRIYSIEEIKSKKESLMILDWDGKNSEKLKAYGFDSEQILFPNVVKNVVIYGAGVYGKKYYDFLSKLGVDVIAFCDRNKSLIGEDIFDLPVISVDELKNRDDINILLGIYPINLPSIEKFFREELNIQKYYKFELGDYVSLVHSDVIPTTKTVFTTFQLSYLIESLKHREEYLFGDLKSIVEASKKLKLFDLNLEGISVDGVIGDFEGIHFINPYELYYSESPHIIVHVLQGFEEDAKRICREIDNENIFFVTDMTNRIEYEILLDVNNGYNVKWKDEKSLIRLGNGKGKKIAILGGSTSDAKLYPEKSWPEMLEKIIAKENKDVDLYCGGVQGYVVSQEMTKLIRDILPINPDILIIYSGLNDAGQKNERYSNYYQDEIFELVVKQSSYDKYYGTPIKDRIEYWKKMILAIQAICETFGIKIFVLTGPTVYSKKIMNNYEKEMIMIEKDHYYNETIPREEYLPKIRELVNSYHKCWFEISHSIFENDEKGFYFLDPVHLTTEGNELLAREIFNAIKEEL